MSLDLEINHATQRKYTIIHGACKDHAGSVTVHPLPEFDLDTTIFTTLEGKLPRLFMTAKIAKESTWNTEIEQSIQTDYAKLKETFEVPSLSAELLNFMETDCDFSAEHADEDGAQRGGRGAAAAAAGSTAVGRAAVGARERARDGGGCARPAPLQALCGRRSNRAAQRAARTGWDRR